jgi:hypothetical protein
MHDTTVLLLYSFTPIWRNALSRTIHPCCIQQACPIPSWIPTLGRYQYHFLLPFPAFFACKLHKIRVATKRLTSPSTVSLRLPSLVCSEHSDTSQYTLDTLNVPFSLLSTRSMSQVLRMCRATPSAPKTRFLIITPQMSAVKNVCFRWTTFSIMTTFFSYHL